MDITEATRGLLLVTPTNNENLAVNHTQSRTEARLRNITSNFLPFPLNLFFFLLGRNVSRHSSRLKERNRDL